jgi:hypothetical protein
MRIHAIRRFVAAGAAVATLVSLGFGSGTALADPSSTPSLDTVTGVGSFSMGALFDNGVPGGDSGTFVHDYNATSPAYPVASWDAVDPSTGVGGLTITTKAASSSDTSCQLTRPISDNGGIGALNLSQTDTNKDSAGQTVYCIDYARSSRAPNTSTFEDAFVNLARDGLDWSYPVVSGETNPQPASLTRTQLTAIFDCQDTNWDQVGGKDAPIGVVLPVAGSGTRVSWLLDLGITGTNGSCWQNGTITVNATPIIEATGLSAGNVAQFTTTQDFGTTCADGCAPQDDIFPYSIGDWIAQSAAANGVGGHATSIWGHGNLALGEIANVAGTPEEATTENVDSQEIINPSWNPEFLSILYAVTRNGCYASAEPTSTSVCLPSTTPPTGGIAYPTYEVTGLKDLFGPSGWVCTNAVAKADIVSYGFTTISNCGGLVAGD